MEKLSTTPLTNERKGATSFTRAINNEVKNSLNVNSIAAEAALAKEKERSTVKDLVIPAADRKTNVWDMKQYGFLTGDAPDTVNAKLWEHAKHNMNIGLYSITDNIYQVRGFDLANITFVLGGKGFIVIDPLTCEETARAAYKLVCEKLGNRPVSAVIFTHSHVDHYGGIYGIIGRKSSVPLYAPVGFHDAVAEENLYAGIAMSRRSYYMYGSILPRDSKGQVDGGLGKYAASGKQGLVSGTETKDSKDSKVTFISKATETFEIDEVEVKFQLTNGTEAPSEMNVYFVKDQSLCIAENCTSTLHNLYTLRGAQVRDPGKWVDFLDQTISLFGRELENVFSTHHWPRFQKEQSIRYMKSQRDCYQYIKDQTLRLMSKGYTIDEVGRMVKLPESLTKDFFNGEFYGTVSHNAKAVYQKYLGWYDSNPVNLNKLLPEDSAKKYVEYMGGADKVLQAALEDYQKGEYQWVAEVTKQLIFADPDNEQARFLCADALEQLGYIAESGPWRNEYLFAAQELRHGVHLPVSSITLKKDVYDGLDMKHIANMIAIRLNGEAASKANLTFKILATNKDGETNKHGNFHLRNGVLAYLGDIGKTKMEVSMSDEVLYMLATGASGKLEYTVWPSDQKPKFDAFVAMLDTPDVSFNIVTP